MMTITGGDFFKDHGMTGMLDMIVAETNAPRDAKRDLGATSLVYISLHDGARVVTAEEDLADEIKREPRLRKPSIGNAALCAEGRWALSGNDDLLGDIRLNV